MENRPQAFEFSLRDEDGKEVRLADFSGKWLVLYFYPRDNTPGCTTEANEFTALEDQFANAGAEVAGVSPDSCASHSKFKVKHGLRVKLLSDPERIAIKRFSAWGEKKLYGKILHGLIRSTVLIDPRGRIARHWPRVRARGHALQVLETLKQLQAESR